MTTARERSEGMKWLVFVCTNSGVGSDVSNVMMVLAADKASAIARAKEIERGAFDFWAVEVDDLQDGWTYCA